MEKFVKMHLIHLKFGMIRLQRNHNFMELQTQKNSIKKCLYVTFENFKLSQDNYAFSYKSGFPFYWPGGNGVEFQYVFSMWNFSQFETQPDRVLLWVRLINVPEYS